MEEAAGFDWLAAMNAGKVLATGTPQELLDKTGTNNLDAAFIALLPDEIRTNYAQVVIPPRSNRDGDEVAIEAEHLTMRFGDFTAVDDVSFRIPRGEIFGFLGSNGCGKSTTMKMLTGLLAASEGTARLFGKDIDATDMEIRHRVGYMSQAFSLYSELTVRQNLDLHARLFSMPTDRIGARIDEMATRFDIVDVLDALPDALPMGIRQRLSLAVAMIHSPDILILDEPTSGVDPIARDGFWQILADLSRKDNVTIFISTHFMNEAERCDRISLMHAGKVLISDTTTAIVEKRGAKTLEEAFIAYLEDAIGSSSEKPAPPPPAQAQAADGALPPAAPSARRFFDYRRMFSYTRREALELMRDPIRAIMASLGSVLLMLVLGYGITMDINNLSFAVLDRDDTTISRDYTLQIAGSQYFSQKSPILDYDDMNRRMRSNELSVAIEIPANFGRDVTRGRAVEIGVWYDGAMPARADSVRGYIDGIHALWLSQKARELSGRSAMIGDYQIAVRYRYNPDIKSLVAMVPAVIPLLLLIIPAMLATLSVAREKELGSIVNLYVTPITRLEFLLGKQLPYIAFGVLNFALLTAVAIFLFQVPFTGSIIAFASGATLYVIATTAMGLLVSTFASTQTAAIFATAILTMIPAMQYSGMMDPVSTLEGAGYMIGQIYPTTHFITISRGAFSKALGLGDLARSLLPLIIAIPVILGLATVFLKKQAH